MHGPRWGPSMTSGVVARSRRPGWVRAVSESRRRKLAVSFYPRACGLRQGRLPGTPEDCVHPHRIRPGRRLRGRAPLSQARPPQDCRERFVIGAVRTSAGLLRVPVPVVCPCPVVRRGRGEAGLHEGLTKRQFRRAARALSRLGPLLDELKKPKWDDSVERVVRERAVISVNRSEHRPYTDRLLRRRLPPTGGRAMRCSSSGTGAPSTPEACSGDCGVKERRRAL